MREWSYIQHNHDDVGGARDIAKYHIEIEVVKVVSDYLAGKLDFKNE